MSCSSSVARLRRPLNLGNPSRVLVDERDRRSMDEIEGSTELSEMVWKSSPRTMRMVLQLGKYTRMIQRLLSMETKRANSERGFFLLPRTV